MIKVIGIGPGSREWLPPVIDQIVASCEVLFGGKRALELFPNFPGDCIILSGKLSETIQEIRLALTEKKQVGVLVSGDPGFYSFLPMLKREFPKTEISVYPGISSMQFAFARAGLPWQEAELHSVHGRPLNRLPLTFQKPLAILTGGENTPQKVAAYYDGYGINLKISLGNLLSYPEEEWVTTDAQMLAQEKKTYNHAIVLLYPPSLKEGDNLENTQTLENAGLGIPDEEFIRGKVPLTKEEIRVQVLAKAKIQENDKVLDVGAGTGSLSIEAAQLARRGWVFAVEEDNEAQELILLNQTKFGIPNLQLVRGTAPQAFEKVPQVDVCLIGGSHGQLKEILEKAPLRSGGRVVLTAVTLETVGRGLELLQQQDFEEIDVISIQAVRWKGIKDFHMAQAMNPVFILNARKRQLE
ncbi:bifunctional cobalt-precorrin-7 (C(5))-methyltransferase/cobalt-precorrin-6B (C(15))-methyltransferase [Desulfitobacterium metallireducens]|uniref:Precorrin-6Y-methylase n=1 Tax=Desulfitobacterium metallireducens DSM 15288 TaxID=871968 RepID=W0E9V3_9FIRM|nr:bifunctional cobalt-precorrin-7 (C(5))-methyltransferase/cobalt-precorrin-6B (C(15))-methyltransferase [Desulfitobacterium metallireducens]AHF06293.1 precorrin-6Y-methylase [Desulfitobacterium metallireducens DSM 15288]